METVAEAVLAERLVVRPLTVNESTRSVEPSTSLSLARTLPETGESASSSPELVSSDATGASLTGVRLTWSVTDCSESFVPSVPMMVTVLRVPFQLAVGVNV